MKPLDDQIPQPAPKPAQQTASLSESEEAVATKDDASIDSAQAPISWIAFVVLTAWASIAWFSHYQYRPPPPIATASNGATTNQFSAISANEILKSVFGDQIPHPAGTEQNEIVRNRIIKLLSEFGYNVKTQTGAGRVHKRIMDRSATPTVPLTNIVTRIEGNNRSDEAIAIVAHYDSVPFGPGISDDGIGCAAVLEIARMLAAEFKLDPTSLTHDIIILITDGEELGLLGAKLFVANHEWLDDISMVINLEARGTTGPSMMFETGSESRWLVPIYARLETKTMTSSLFYEIYKKLPNDTDFSIFKKADKQGFNFAYIGKGLDYHTVGDNLENADLGSLQHHGDNALGLIRQLNRVNELSADEGETGRAVFFDVFGWQVFWWPERWSVIFSVIGLLLFLGYVFRNLKSTAAETEVSLSKIDVKPDLACLFKTGIAMAGFVLLGWILVKLSSYDSKLQPRWSEQPLPYILGFWFCAVACLAFACDTLLKRYRFETTLKCVIAFWVGMALLTSFKFTGGSYLFIVPTVLICAMVNLIPIRSSSRQYNSHRDRWLALMLPIFVGVMWIPLERLFYDAVGFRMSNLMLIRVAIVSSSLVPGLKLLGSQSLFLLAIASSVFATGAFVWARLLI